MKINDRFRKLVKFLNNNELEIQKNLEKFTKKIMKMSKFKKLLKIIEILWKSMNATKEYEDNYGQKYG